MRFWLSPLGFAVVRCPANKRLAMRLVDIIVCNVWVPLTRTQNSHVIKRYKERCSSDLSVVTRDRHWHCVWSGCVWHSQQNGLWLLWAASLSSLISPPLAYAALHHSMIVTASVSGKPPLVSSTTSPLVEITSPPVVVEWSPTGEHVTPPQSHPSLMLTEHGHVPIKSASFRCSHLFLSVGHKVGASALDE